MVNRLNKQQQRRLKQQHNARLRGKSSDDAAIVVAHLGYEVIVNDHGELITADWRQALGDIAVNDRVLLQRGSDGRGIIEAIFPRQHTLYKTQGRKTKALASHIDQLLIVLAARPQWQPGLLDRYLIAAHAADIDITIVCNKIDLLSAQEQQQWQAALAPYQQIGYTILPLSVNNGVGLEAISARLSDKQSIICGQSGVGKSSLIAALIKDSAIWTQTLSDTTGHGRHTTTNSRRYPYGDDGAVIDTPGVRGFAIRHLEQSTIIAGFKEIAPYIGHCRFSDCSHRHEPDCAVLRAIAAQNIDQSRYHSLIQILEENCL